LGNKVLLKNYDPMDVARAVAFVLIILLAIERYAPKLINALSPKATSAAVATERVADK
jgi:hypothetical protein